MFIGDGMQPEMNKKYQITNKVTEVIYCQSLRGNCVPYESNSVQCCQLDAHHHLGISATVQNSK